MALVLGPPPTLSRSHSVRPLTLTAMCLVGPIPDPTGRALPIGHARGRSPQPELKVLGPQKRPWRGRTRKSRRGGAGFAAGQGRLCSLRAVGRRPLPALQPGTPGQRPLPALQPGSRLCSRGGDPRIPGSPPRRAGRSAGAAAAGQRPAQRLRGEEGGDRGRRGAAHQQKAQLTLARALGQNGLSQNGYGHGPNRKWQNIGPITMNLDETKWDRIPSLSRTFLGGPGAVGGQIV